MKTYTAKLVWFNKGPAWTCQKDNRHVITIHWGDTMHSRKQAQDTAARLELIESELSPASVEAIAQS